MKSRKLHHIRTNTSTINSGPGSKQKSDTLNDTKCDANTPQENFQPNTVGFPKTFFKLRPVVVCANCQQRVVLHVETLLPDPYFPLSIPIKFNCPHCRHLNKISKRAMFFIISTILSLLLLTLLIIPSIYIFLFENDYIHAKSDGTYLFFAIPCATSWFYIIPRIYIELAKKPFQ